MVHLMEKHMAEHDDHIIFHTPIGACAAKRMEVFFSQRAQPPNESLPPHDTYGAAGDRWLKHNGIQEKPKPPHQSYKP